MTVLDIADQLAQLLEPDPELRDDSRAQPAVYEVDKLYLWAPAETFEVISTGPLEQRNFALRAAWVIASDEVELRSRETSDAIAARAEAMRAVVAGKRALDTFWDWLQVDGIDYEDLDGIDARGFYMDLSGYIELN